MPIGKRWHWQVWISEELAILTKHYAESSETELLMLLPRRHLPAIHTKAHSIGLKRSKIKFRERQRERAKAIKLHLLGRHNLWDKDEIELFKNSYPTITIYQLMELFPRRTRSSLEHMRHKLGLSKTQTYQHERRLKSKETLKKARDKRNNRWAKTELQIVRDKYTDSPKEEILQLLPKRTWSAILHQAHRMRLTRSNEAHYKLLRSGEINPATWTHKKPTRIERRLIDIIAKANLPYKYVGDGSFRIYRLNPDFINCNNQKKLIEIFGRVFHDPSRAFKKAIALYQQEPYRKAIYASLGFDCLVLWDDEMGKFSDEEIADKIKNFTKSRHKPTAQLPLK